MEKTIPVRRPGGAIASRPLDFIWVCDTSGSMAGAKIARLNFAINDALGPMREAADENPQAKVFVRAMSFDDDARWVIEERTPLAEFGWTALQAERGFTAMGAALSLAAKALSSPSFPEQSWPPVIVLVTDGFPTDDIPGQPNFASGLQELLAVPAGRHATRLAIGIGDEADLNVLRAFIADTSIEPLQAKTAGELVHYIRWASSASIRRSSAPRLLADAAKTEPAFAPGPIRPIEGGDITWSEPLK